MDAEDRSFELEQLRLLEIRLSLREPFHSATGVVAARRVLLVEIEPRDAAPVWTECVALESPHYTPECFETAWLALRDWLAPRVLGQEMESPLELAALLAKGVRGHEMARAAIEMGAWTLLAERWGQSLSTVLGGSRQRVGTGIALGLEKEPAVLVDKARKAIERGYQRLKVKIEPGRDVDFLLSLRQAVGDAVSIVADANSAYAAVDWEIFERLDTLGLTMIEQPLEWNDLVQHARLQERLETPLCLDESVTDLGRAREMVELRAARVLNLKPGRVGGLGSAKAIHDLCFERQIPVWCGGMLETGIGRAYNVALASLPNFSRPGDLSPSERYWQQDIVWPHWTMDGEGWVDVPTAPGLGVEIDVERIEALKVREEVLRARNRVTGP